MKKSIRKTFAVCCMVLLLIPLCSFSTLAAEEITQQELNEKTSQHYDDVEQTFVKANNAVQITNPNTGEKLVKDAYISPEYKVIDMHSTIISPEKSLINSSNNVYAVDMVANVTNADLVAVGAASSYNMYDEKWSTDTSVQLWGRFYYLRSSNSVLVTQVEGGFYNREAGRQYISSQLAQASCCDEYIRYQVKDYQPFGDFSYATGFTDYADTGKTTMMTRIGLGQELTVQRYAGDYDFNVNLVIAPWGWGW